MRFRRPRSGRQHATSPAPREWFGHDPERWDEFRKPYTGEVHENPHQLRQMRVRARSGLLTLIRSAHDEVRSDAIVLRELMLGRPSRYKSKTSNSRN